MLCVTLFPSASPQSSTRAIAGHPFGCNFTVTTAEWMRWSRLTRATAAAAMKNDRPVVVIKGADWAWKKKPTQRHTQCPSGRTRASESIRSEKTRLQFATVCISSCAQCNGNHCFGKGTDHCSTGQLNGRVNDPTQALAGISSVSQSVRSVAGVSSPVTDYIVQSIPATFNKAFRNVSNNLVST